MRHPIAVAVAAAGGLALGVLAGCGLEGLSIEDEGGGSGPVCYTDSDCVPNACCGGGTGAVHISEAPDCRGRQCDGRCPSDLIECGCGIPVCRKNHCEAAFTSNDRCG
ncbi:MAG TPA: hypothetical protein VE549_04005 [Myxococcaceae bacterium]|jgi:hypothetical protein|nr:hypothetical protein [Myxococcaceae bacterium]